MEANTSHWGPVFQEVIHQSWQSVFDSRHRPLVPNSATPSLLLLLPLIPSWPLHHWSLPPNVTSPWSSPSFICFSVLLPSVAVILCATTKQGEGKVNCQDVSQSAQGGDKSRRTCQLLWSVLELMSFVQEPIEVSRSRQERGVKEDKLDCYCVTCRVYIHTALSTY